MSARSSSRPDGRLRAPTGFPGGGVELSGWRAAVADEDLRRAYPDRDFDDRGWEPIPVPGHWRSTPAFSSTDGPLLYRTRFGSPAPFGPGGHDAEVDEPRRTWLVVDGLFYTSDIWIDGAYLGDTEGYFFPQSFEISDAIAAQAEHTLAIEVSCRPETDRRAKRNLTGVFQHWDLIDRDWNPGGIWRPVRLEQSGPVHISHWRTLCQEATDEQAVVVVRTILDTVDARPVELVTRIVPVGAGPTGASGGEGIEHRQSLPLAQGQNRIEWTVTVPEPRLWWPHALGDQPLYDVHVEVRAPDEEGGFVSDHRVRRLGLRSIAAHNWIFSINGERLFLKGTNQGPSRRALAEASDAELTRDIALAKEANLDFVRVHAHVSRPALYDAADEAGVLLWQDMPLQWGYHRSIRRQARRQARELVDLLAHHPSIFVWCGHNEPLAIDAEPDALTDRSKQARLVARFLAGQLLPTWNKSVLDHSIKKVIERTDGSRPVVAHSGILPHPPQLDGTDSHLYFGWYHGDERDFPTAVRAWPRLARFVTEFGAQAVPEDASFLEPERWPDLDWDRAEREHSLQRSIMERYVPASDYDSFEAWKQATQRYQAEVIRHHIETLRRIKYGPCGGFAQFHLADNAPSVTWSVLGHDRQPKQGYAALAAACQPVIIVADRLPAIVRPGQPLALDVHVVSDARIAHDDMLLRAHLSQGEAGALASTSDSTPSATRSPSSSSKSVWSWHGDVPADSCVRVGTIETVVDDGPGPLVLALALVDSAGTVIARNRYETTVATDGPRPSARRLGSVGW